MFTGASASRKGDVIGICASSHRATALGKRRPFAGHGQPTLAPTASGASALEALLFLGQRPLTIGRHRYTLSAPIDTAQQTRGPE